MNQAKYIEFSQKSPLFWYVKEDQKEKLPLELVVETILNYEHEKDVQELFEIVGMEKVAECFYRQTTKKNAKRSNYFPQTENF